MRQGEIVVGAKYTDGNGNVREVLAHHPNDHRYGHLLDKNTVDYRLTARKTSPQALGSLHNCTLRKFAFWAKEVAK